MSPASTSSRSQPLTDDAGRPLPRPCARRPSRLGARRRTRRGRRGDLPPARRPAARHRAGRGSRRGPAADGHPRSPRSSVAASRQRGRAMRRRASARSTSAVAWSHDLLDARPPGAAPRPRGLRWRLRPRTGRRWSPGRRATAATGSMTSWTSPIRASSCADARRSGPGPLPDAADDRVVRAGSAGRRRPGGGGPTSTCRGVPRPCPRRRPHLNTSRHAEWIDRVGAGAGQPPRPPSRWAIDAGHGDLALRLIGPSWRFWHAFGQVADGRALTERALAMPDAPTTGLDRAWAEAAAGSLAYWQADTAAARRHYEAQVALATRGRTTRRGVADGCFNLGHVLYIQGDDDGAPAGAHPTRSSPAIATSATSAAWPGRAGPMPSSP